MTAVKSYIDQNLTDCETQRKLAGAAIAQFLVMRDGLKHRMEDGQLDATAATLTAAVLTAQGLLCPLMASRFDPQSVLASTVQAEGNTSATSATQAILR